MRQHSLCSWLGVWTVLLAVLSLCSTVTAKTTYVTYTTPDGQTLYLDDNRKPALFTRDYGDCQGDSLVNVTRFDAAYYKDNMTVTFHLGGQSLLKNDSLMMYIGVYAYGQNRFNLTFNPCAANIRSLCPLNYSVPVEAVGIIPLAPADVSGFPDIALTIPDFEGQAILRIFANSTESQIACYSAVLSNGNSLSHPVAIGSTVGVFVAIALMSSIGVAIYGRSAPETRNHYAHSLSMFVVFSVLQHVFYTGALSMNFPSVLVAFWSNFGWASGMIYSEPMQASINRFIGNNRGDIRILGSAATGQNAQNLGGGYSLSSIYKRSADIPFQPFEGFGTLHPRAVEAALNKRAIINSTSGFTWYGDLIDAGLPLPGNYSGFAGTLAELGIPASNAFLTGLIWFLILIALMIGMVTFLKIAIETLAAIKIVKSDRFRYFRSYWIFFISITVARTCYIGFFMMMFLTLFQFAFGGGAGVLAVTAIVFVLYFIGMVGIVIYALWYRLRSERFHRDPDRLELKAVPARFASWFGVTTEKRAQEKGDSRRTVMSFPWLYLHFTDPAQRAHVHDDESYLLRFGWLYARFRRSKWWFFSAWLVYEFVRACFYGAAAGMPLTQVFGLLVWEIISLIAIILIKPFESNRLNLLMVYFLGFSKVASVALSSAFDPRFGLDRILTTVIGVIIIVIQGVLVICLMVFIIIGAISSYFSIKRFQDTEAKPFTPRQIKYFAHIEQKASDKPLPKPVVLPVETPDEPKEPYFNVSTVRRELKIEDEDTEKEVSPVDEADDDETRVSMEIGKQTSQAPSRTQSMKSKTSFSSLPYGARRHQASWSTRDFQDEGILSSRSARPSFENMPAAVLDGPSRQRSGSLRSKEWADPARLANAAQAAPEPRTGRHKRSLSSIQHAKRHSAFAEATMENENEAEFTGTNHSH